MKSRTKSTKANLTIETRKPRKSTELKQPHPQLQTQSLSKKAQSEIRHNLQDSYRILQKRLRLNGQNLPTSLVSISQLLYKTIKDGIPQPEQRVNEKVLVVSSSRTKARNNEKPTATLHSVNSSSADLTSGKENKHNRSQSVMEYFKEKFGSPAKDEQSVEKKLKVLKVLRKAQGLSSKYNSHSMQQESFNGKQDIMEKVKEKSRR